MIVSGPENAKDRIGKNVALVCEATGYPIPTIEWTWTRVDGKTEYLPSDDMHISVNMRGGPEKWQVTGWLQVRCTRRRGCACKPLTKSDPCQNGGPNPTMFFIVL